MMLRKSLEKLPISVSRMRMRVRKKLYAITAGMAAIPAVIAYNFFLTRIRILDTEMGNFSSDFLNIIKRHFF